jgi:hypothetical protein
MSKVHSPRQSLPVLASLNRSNLAAIRGRKLGRRFLLPEFLGIDAVLGAASGVVTEETMRFTS